ncbi:protein-disulfide reductase DsbD family protein [Portibacter lacus]|uniref:Thiol:disulfide interchange protein DsbD n=1 Tax=Portibacter lacus TaxID=1099794 RepID=A0AA37SN91_9BACT|nr:cytochrome c biogenesis protein CcdA [Portibacter lacus]GLR16564.1 thiol:disulfide interchange protein DsbD [Portibacter lacus]
MLRFLSVSILLFFTVQSFGQLADPVKWSFSSEKVSEKEYVLIYTAKIDKGWTVYSQETNEDGPVPTEITYESEGVSYDGKGEEIGHKKEGLDSYFDVVVTKFLDDEDFIIKHNVKVDPGVTNVSGFLTFMACDDSKCLPPTDIDFDINLADGKSSDVPSGVMSISMNGTDNAMPSGVISPVKWSFEITNEGNDEYLLKYIANAEEGWSVYSQFTNDDGPVPTLILYEEEDHYSVVDRSVEKGHKKKGLDPFFDGVEVIKFLSDEPFIIEHRIKTTDPSKEIKGGLEFMACDDTECLPPDFIDFSFKPSILKGGIVAISEEEVQKSTEEGNVIDNTIPKIVSSLENPTAECGGIQELSTNLWLTFIFGFIGGLLALLTPCVFPMIPLTVSFFTKDTKRKGWVNGLIYGASIIVIYVTLGIVITAVFGADSLNRLSTNWIANSIFFLVFIFFAFSFFGYYEITLPSSWSNKSDKMADKGGFVGIFFMAFTLAIVSFSCTGPIIGSAIVESASSKIGPSVVMTGFALALAIPFGLFAAFPAWLNSLPKSGSWMTSVKVVLGFLEIALAFKFLSVADLTNHWGFLRYELFIGIWIVVAILIVLYLLGYIRFPHDAPVKKIKPLRWGFIGLFAAAAIYLMTGFNYNEKTQAYDSKELLSGLAPPAQYNFFLEKPTLNPDLKERFYSYKKCANNLDCFTDYYEGVAYAKEVNKPVFLDFTGHACVNCRKMEEHVWIKTDVHSKLSNDFVLVSLYSDDDKDLDEKIYSVTQDKYLRDVGNMWTDFQIANFGSNTQPLYAMMTPDEEIIGQPRGYDPNYKEYVEFLECGLANFNKQKILIGEK